MGCYETADGRWFSFSANTERSIRAVMRALELDGDDRFDGYDACLKNHGELDDHARRWIRQRSAEAIVLAFDAAGAPGTPVMSASDLNEDPQVQHREMVVIVPDDDLGQVRMQGIVKLSRTPGAITHAGQRMGQANEQVFGELLGLTTDQLADLQERGVI